MIGPFESADRVWSYRWWPLYILLLLAVEIHGGVGLYRLAVKWGVLAGPDAAATRKRLKTREMGADRVLPRAGRRPRSPPTSRSASSTPTRWASATCPRWVQQGRRRK